MPGMNKHSKNLEFVSYEGKYKIITVTGINHIATDMQDHCIHGYSYGCRFYYIMKIFIIFI